MALSPMLNDRGRLIGDFTVANLTPTGDVDAAHGRAATGRSYGVIDGAERFMVFGSGVAEHYHERWFLEHLTPDTRLDVHGRSLCGLSLAGPHARDVLSRLVDDDLSTDAWRFLDIRETWVGAVPCIVSRVTFTGDLGYEIWMEAAAQVHVFDHLVEAGQEFGIRPFGARALDSLRLEKSFGAWATEYRPIYTPHEAGLGWAVKPAKGDFMGRDAVLSGGDRAQTRQLVFFRVDVDMGPEGADVIGDEPIWRRGGPGGDEVVGWVTSGGYAHWSRASVAMGYVRSDLLEADDVIEFEIEIFGRRRPAVRLHEPLFDPSGSRMRR